VKATRRGLFSTSRSKSTRLGARCLCGGAARQRIVFPAGPHLRWAVQTSRVRLRTPHSFFLSSAAGDTLEHGYRGAKRAANRIVQSLEDRVAWRTAEPAFRGLQRPGT